MHPDDSPASEQGDDQLAQSDTTRFQVMNHLAEPVGPRHDSPLTVEHWVSAEYGRLPAGFSIETVNP